MACSSTPSPGEGLRGGHRALARAAKPQVEWLLCQRDGCRDIRASRLEAAFEGEHG
jgi:hypothetical protein